MCIKLRNIETYIPNNIVLSSINNLGNKVKKVNLEVNFNSKKIFEDENNIYVVLDTCDNSGSIKSLLIGNRDNNEFISLIDNIKIDKKYKISGNVSNYEENDEMKLLPFIDEIRNNKLIFVYSLQCCN